MRGGGLWGSCQNIEILSCRSCILRFFSSLSSRHVVVLGGERDLCIVEVELSRNKMFRNYKLCKIVVASYQLVEIKVD